MAFLAFLGCLLGIILVALLTNRLTGTRAHYIENFRPDLPEHILWWGDGADVHIVPRTPQALIVSFARLRRDTLSSQTRDLSAAEERCWEGAT